MAASGSRPSFEAFTTELLEVCDLLPVPMMVALDPECTKTHPNAAYRALAGSTDLANHLLRSQGVELTAAQLPTRVAARTGTGIENFPLQFDRDGTEVSIIASAWPLRDEAGGVRGSIGIYIDVTDRIAVARSSEKARQELRDAEARYRLIAEAMPQFVWIDAPDGSAVYANRRWLDYIGLSPEQNAGYGWTATVHPEDAARLDPVRAETLRSGEDFEGECRYKGRDGKYRWFLFRSIAIRDAGGAITSWVGTATDIDRQKRAEHQQQFFATASERLGSTLDETTALQRIAELCVPDLADWCVIDLIDPDTAELRTVIVEHANAAKRDRLQRLLGPSLIARDVEFGPAYVARTREPQILPHVDRAMMERALSDPADRKLLADAGYSSALIVPLHAGEQVYGALTLVSSDPARLYTEFDLTTTVELARRAAIAIGHTRMFEREHMVATTLQRALLPSELPRTPDLRFDSAYSAAVTGEQVGGDWYDAFPLPNGRIALSIGDVAGHGLAAAVTMGTVRQAIRTAALERSQPDDVLYRANSALSLERGETMVTAIFATYEPHSRLLEYAIAGHPRPLVVDPHGKITVLDGDGPPLGLLYETQRVEMKRATLPKGASVVFFTDGLVEFNRDIASAEARLKAVLALRLHAISKNPAAEIIARVLTEPQNDDIAVLVMTLQEPAEIIDMRLPSLPPAATVAREALRRFAAFHKLDDDRTFELLSAAGEAISNAIEHPYGAGVTGGFRLRVAFSEGAAILDITDQGHWRSTVSEDRGRGFTIMKAIAKTCDVQKSQHGTTVKLTV